MCRPNDQTIPPISPNTVSNIPTALSHTRAHTLSRNESAMSRAGPSHPAMARPRLACLAACTAYELTKAVSAPVVNSAAEAARASVRDCAPVLCLSARAVCVCVCVYAPHYYHPDAVKLRMLSAS